MEAVSLAELVDDALKLNASSFDKYHIEVVREYADIPEVRMEKQKAAANPHEPGDQRQGRAAGKRREDRRLTVRIRVDQQPAQADEC